MKKNQAITSVAAFLMLLNIGVTKAEPDGSGSLNGLIMNVTDQVTNLLSAASSQGGNVSNIAINTKDISSTVTIGTGGPDNPSKLTFSGTPALVSNTVNQTLNSSQLNTNGITGTQNQTVNSKDGNSASSITGTTNNIASSASTVSSNLSAIALANSVSATSIGAMNSGNINLTQANADGLTFNLDIQDLNLGRNSGPGSGQLNGVDKKATYNPSVSNLAMNTSAITSAVTVSTAVGDISIGNTSISAASVGAMNTGNITVTAAPAIPIGRGR
jgi:hypothetical protein